MKFLGKLTIGAVTLVDMTGHAQELVNDTWGVALYGENITDEKYLAESFEFLQTTSIRGWGRLLRLEAHLNF